MVIVVAHAPHDRLERDDTPSRDFWSVISDALRHVPAHVPIFALADANAHLGDVTSEAVGDLDPDSENTAGSVFHSWMVEHDMAAANTFSHAIQVQCNLDVQSQHQARH